MSPYHRPWFVRWLRLARAYWLRNFWVKPRMCSRCGHRVEGGPFDMDRPECWCPFLARIESLEGE